MSIRSQERLQKVLAQAGIASRRRCEDLIVQGRVKVNGRVVTELGTRVDPVADLIHFDGTPIANERRHAYLLLYKPPQVISTAQDPHGRPTVMNLISDEYGRLYPVGRLDWDSEGAILMTNDGTLTDLLTHPRHEVAKVYAVKLKGMWSNDDPRIHKLRGGVRINRRHTTLPAEIIRDDTTGKHTWFIVAIKEGKNRQIRKMFEAVGIDVLKLKRIAYGPVTLADMRPGEFRRLSEQEIDELYDAAGQRRPELSASRGRLSVERREGLAKRRKAARQDVGGATTRRGGAENARSDERRPRREDARDKPRGSGRSGGRNDSRTNPRTDTRGPARDDQRSDSRGGQRSDSRGGQRSDSRGGQRSDSRSSSSRGGQRSDSRGGQRSDSRGGQRSDSRSSSSRGPSRDGQRSDSRGGQRSDSRSSSSRGPSRDGQRSDSRGGQRSDSRSSSSRGPSRDGQRSDSRGGSRGPKKGPGRR